MAVTVLKDGELYFQKGYGYASLENQKAVNPTTTLFRAASASKPLAATALATMVGKGEIDLDASFYDFVPDYPRKKYDFTIRQLAAHTAGIRGYKGKEYALNRPYSIKDSLEVFQDDPLLFKPGTSYHYNSYDWVLISLAMENASGMPFEDIVLQEVLNPLGMKDTIPEIPGEIPESGAEFYTKTTKGFRKAVSVDNRFKLAGGGYLSTSGDLALLGQAYLTQTLIDPSIAKQFLTSQTIEGKPTYYGLGWEVSRDKKGRHFYGHTGNSVGGYSNFYVYPEEQAVIVILINCTNPQVQPVLDEAISGWLEMNDLA